MTFQDPVVTVHAINAYRGGEAQLHSFLPSTLDKGKWPTSRSGRFFPRKITSDAHEVGGFMDFWRRETLLLLTGINPRIISYLNQ
jgi:hypothetical protein